MPKTHKKGKAHAIWFRRCAVLPFDGAAAVQRIVSQHVEEVHSCTPTLQTINIWILKIGYFFFGPGLFRVAFLAAIFFFCTSHRA